MFVTDLRHFLISRTRAKKDREMMRERKKPPKAKVGALIPGIVQLSILVGTSFAYLIYRCVF
jgi:hypothetical protein